MLFIWWAHPSGGGGGCGVCSNIATCTQHSTAPCTTALTQAATVSEARQGSSHSLDNDCDWFFSFFTSIADNPMSYEAITTFRLSPLSRQWRYTHSGRPCLANVAGKSQLDYTGTPIRFSFHFFWLGVPGISRSHWVTHNMNSPGQWVSNRHLITLK
jgi:hypothetical protein